MSISNIWVVVETSDGHATSTSRELLTRAKALGSSVSAISWDVSAESLSEEVGEFGTTTLFDVGSLHGLLPGVPVAMAIAALVASVGAPDAIFVPSSNDGRDIAGHLSARLDRTVLTNVVGVDNNNGLATEHLVLGGTLTVKARFCGSAPGILVIRSKSCEPELSSQVSPHIVSAPWGESHDVGAAMVIGSHVEVRSGPALEEATVIVAGGRGIGNAASYALIEETAQLLHGAPGASRAIVDAGWVPYSYQVGQTGKTVKPLVYIACGISGATQHMVGMMGSQKVVAINKDADAPIFQIADLGIVGDVHEVLPALIESLRARSREQVT